MPAEGVPSGSWQRIRGVLFDKDGTLFHYHETWSPVNRAAALSAAEGDADVAARLLELGGVDPVSGRAAQGSLLAAGHTGEIAAAWADELGLSVAARQALVGRLDEVFARLGPLKAVPVMNLPVLFGRLRWAGLKIGVATSDGEPATRAMLSRFVDLAAVDFVAGYDSGHGVKPGPGMVQAFCTATGLAPGQVVMVGDNLHDLRMGRAAGCGLAIGVLTGTGGRPELGAEADEVLDDVAVLLRRLVPTEPGRPAPLTG